MLRRRELIRAAVLMLVAAVAVAAAVSFPPPSCPRCGGRLSPMAGFPHVLECPALNSDGIECPYAVDTSYQN